MFGKSFELLRVFGFAIRVDASWFLLAVLITWTLATGYFPSTVPELGASTYWIMGALGALGLFVSVVVHELAHSLVARRYGIEMKGITLFIFGGVAEMTDEPPSPRAELAVAIAGPITSVGVAAVFAGARALATGLAVALPVAHVLGYLAVINLVLAIFNMVPAFPLDGGRVLRSILWGRRGNYREATRVTAGIGSTFGMVLIVLGLVSAVLGNLVGGVWWFLIGLFLRNAAGMSYQRVLLRTALEGEPVSRFMQSDPISVPRALSVRQLVEDYVYRYHFKMFPVVDEERLLGCVTTREIKELDREEWEHTSVGAISAACNAANSISPDEDALAAVAKMSREKSSRLMVVEGKRLVGVLTLKDLLAFFASKVELGDLGETAPRGS